MFGWTRHASQRASLITKATQERISLQFAWQALFYAAYFGFVGLYSPFLGPYLKTLGHGLEVIALALGMMQLMRIVGPFAWGWLADHTANRIRWIRVGSFAGFFFSILVFSFKESATSLIVLILFLNLSISGLVPMSDTHCLESCQGDTGRYGRVRLYGSVGFVLAVLGFGAVADRFGYGSYPFWAVGLLLLTFLVALKFKPVAVVPLSSNLTGAVPDAKRGAGFGRLLLPGAMPVFWLASFFMVLAHGVFYGYYSLYLLEYDYSEMSIGWLWAFGVVCEVVFFAFQTRFFERLPLSAWLCLGYGACAVRFAITAMFPELFLVMAFAQGLHALTFAAHHTASISWLRTQLPAWLVVRGQAMYATIAYGLGGSAGTFLGRYVWEWGSPSAAFWAASVSGAVAFWFGLKLRQAERVLQSEPA